MATDRLTVLTDELLDVTRLQAGQLFLHPAPTDLMALTKRVIERMRRVAPHHQLVINALRSGGHYGRRPRTQHGEALDSATAEFDAASADIAVIAVVDAVRIEQVLTNLITNSIKYSPDGGSVYVTLTLHKSRNAPHVEIQVRDDGIGIPERQHDRIFGRFMRADNARQAGIRGTGLGLYISRGLVEQHGGHIWFESQEGKGTTFFLTVPLHPTQATSGTTTVASSDGRGL